MGGLDPFGAAQLIQPCVGGVLTGADVFAHQVELGGGHIQAVAAGVGDLDIILLHPVHRQARHGHEPADTVVLVHYQVAGSEIGVGLQLLPGGVVFRRSAPRLPAGNLGGELPLGQNSKLQARVFAAGSQCAHRDDHLPFLRHGAAGVIHRGRR